MESVEWRVEICKYCWEFPEYLWIGRGSTFNVFDTVDPLTHSDIMLYTPWFAFQTHAYHSGPLTLLIDYGLPGFLIGTWLLLAIGVTAWKIAAKMVRYRSLESRYCLALCSWLLWQVISFFLVYGQMPKFGRILVAGAVVTVLARSVEGQASLHSDSDASNSGGCVNEVLGGNPSYNQLDWLKLCVASVADQASDSVQIYHHVQDVFSDGIRMAWEYFQYVKI